MTSNKPSCNQCGYFVKICHDEYGECRAKTPVVMRTADGEYIGFFPKIVPGDWCGDFTIFEPQELYDLGDVKSRRERIKGN